MAVVHTTHQTLKLYTQHGFSDVLSPWASGGGRRRMYVNNNGIRLLSSLPPPSLQTIAENSSIELHQ